MTAFGDFIRLERLARRMTRDELGWRLGTTARVVGSWERGERAPNRKNADRLFRWLRARNPLVQPKRHRAAYRYRLDGTRLAPIVKKTVFARKERRPAGQSGLP
jgi:transcriptional regulator with XRE-family HTH domain